jgi:hypothetical protein
MFDKLKNVFKKKQPEEPVQEKPKQTRKKKSEKEIATEKGEPWVGILSMDVDPEDLNAGAFELDWNDQFVARLIRFGYQGKTDADLVDQWFQNVCRHVVLETWEQEQAQDPKYDVRYHKKRNLGDGYSEIS